jgi:hypothetical protein
MAGANAIFPANERILKSWMTRSPKEIVEKARKNPNITLHDSGIKKKASRDSNFKSPAPIPSFKQTGVHKRTNKAETGFNSLPESCEPIARRISEIKRLRLRIL